MMQFFPVIYSFFDIQMFSVAPDSLTSSAYEK
jgi:hypothetical protein